MVVDNDTPVCGAEGDAIVAQLRAFLATKFDAADGRLPPEREFAETLGITRAELRKALSVLEAESLIWRQVGKGTFVGGHPLDTFADVASLAKRTGPADAMQARLALEPEIARIAALHARPKQIEYMTACMQSMQAAGTWREYESWDGRFHRTIAEATQNPLLLGLFDTLNAVRRSVTWGRLRPTDRPRPPRNHHSFAEHGLIATAIGERDMNAAASAMRDHLLTVQTKLLGRAQNERDRAAQLQPSGER